MPVGAAQPRFHLLRQVHRVRENDGTDTEVLPAEEKGGEWGRGGREGQEEGEVEGREGGGGGGEERKKEKRKVEYEEEKYYRGGGGKQNMRKRIIMEEGETEEEQKTTTKISCPRGDRVR